MRPLREAAADLREILAQEEAVFGSRGYAERFGDPDPDGFPAARAPTVPTPGTLESRAEQTAQNPGTASAIQTAWHSISDPDRAESGYSISRSDRFAYRGRWVYGSRCRHAVQSRVARRIPYC